MVEQVCPHCQKNITNQDILEYSAKISRVEKECRDKEKLEPVLEEFRNSDIFRKHQRIFWTSISLVFISGVLIPALNIIFINQNPWLTLSLIVAWPVVSIGGLFYLVIRLDRLRDSFVKSKLQDF